MEKRSKKKQRFVESSTRRLFCAEQLHIPRDHQPKIPLSWDEFLTKEDEGKTMMMFENILCK